AVDGIRDRNVTGVQTCALPILLFLIVIYGSDFADRFYSQIQSTFVNIAMVIIMFVLSYFLGLIIYRNYYLEDTARPMFFDTENLEEIAIKGMKQLRVELFGCVLAILLAIGGFGFFCSS